MVAADGPSADEAGEAHGADEAPSSGGEPYAAGSESAIQAEPTVVDMEPEVGAIDGLEPTEFETPAGDVAPIEGLEARDLDAETGLVGGAGAAEPGSVGDEAEGPAEEAWSDAPWESAADEDGVEPGDPESDQAESPWMADDWSTAEDDAETPYAWAGEEEEEEEDGSSPIGDYLGQMLQWGAGMAPLTGPSAPATGVDGAEDGAPAEAGGEPVDAPASEPPSGEDDDDDLEMFRSWLESLKQ